MKVLRQILGSFFVLAVLLAPMTLAAQITPVSTVCPPYAVTNTRLNANPNNNQNDLLKVRAWAKRPVQSGAADSTNTDLVLLVAHRGIWEFCPENTLEAYEVAADAGADGIEMDLRPSGAGNDAAGVNWPYGEIFLTHDYDLRGEAPGGDGSFQQNNIYYATPAQLQLSSSHNKTRMTSQGVPVPWPQGRSMVDRHGNPALDASGSGIQFWTLTDMLYQLYARAQAIAAVHPNTNIGIDKSQGTGVCNRPPYPAVSNGPFLVLDIKGDEGISKYVASTIGASNNRYPSAPNTTPTPGDGTWVAIQETMKEVHAFEVANCVDLERAIVYKVKFGKVRADSTDTVPTAFPGVDPTLPTNWTDLVGTFYPIASWPTPPGLIAITYPDDLSKDLASTELFQRAPGYWMTNWNVRYRGIRTEGWSIATGGVAMPGAYYDLTHGRGNSGFASTNVFPEGTRRSDGSCCDVQPFAQFTLSAFDFLFQPANNTLLQYQLSGDTATSAAAPYPQTRATLQTIDALDNSFSYLQQIGKRTTSHISWNGQ